MKKQTLNIIEKKFIYNRFSSLTGKVSKSIAVFQLIIFLFSCFGFVDVFPNAQSFEKQEKSFIYLSSNTLFYPFAKNNEINKGLNKPFPIPSYDGSNSDFTIKNRITDLIFENTFSNYINYADALYISLRQTDIIFPFNYFW